MTREIALAQIEAVKEVCRQRAASKIIHYEQLAEAIADRLGKAREAAGWASPEDEQKLLAETKQLSKILKVVEALLTCSEFGRTL